MVGTVGRRTVLRGGAVLGAAAVAGQTASSTASAAERGLDADVAVVGVGSVGSMALWRIAERGLSAIGFEQFTAPNPYCAVGGDTRLYRLAYKEGPQYDALLRRSRELWLELNKRGRRDVFATCGALAIGPASGSYITDLLKSAEQQNATVHRLSPRQLRARYPLFKVAGDDIGVLDPAGGMLRTDLAVTTATNLAVTAGARLQEHSRIRALHPERDAVRIETDDRTWRVGTLVLTAGAWMPSLAPEVCPGTRVKSIPVAWYVAGDPKAATDVPVFIRDDGERHVYGTPSTDGATIKLGAISSIEVADAAKGRRTPDADELRPATPTVTAWFNDVDPAPVRTEAYPDLYSEDGSPLIGTHPEHRNIHYATGFSGSGFKYSPAVGDRLADLCTT